MKNSTFGSILEFLWGDMKNIYGRWPNRESFKKRYLVADLSPEQRPQLKGFAPDFIFVAESPHEAETASADALVRRPLCGKAGQVWWKMVGELLTGDLKRTFGVDLETQLELCRKGKFAIMNAVQFPLDPKITLYYGPSADPVDQLGFSKVPPASFKKLRKTEAVESAVEILRARLTHASVAGAPVISLGNDAKWFIDMALGPELAARHLETIPHPSAWWRQGGKLRERAREQLTCLFRERPRAKQSQALPLGLARPDKSRIFSH